MQHRNTMKLIAKILELEGRYKSWVETNRFKWYSILTISGVLLGVGANLILHGSSRQGMLMSSVFSMLLILCEFSIGGQGIE